MDKRDLAEARSNRNFVAGELRARRADQFVKRTIEVSQVNLTTF
jgi:hypothetical protein